MNNLISYEERRYVFARLEKKNHTVKRKKWLMNFQDSLQLTDFRTVVETMKMINVKFDN